MFTVLSAVPWSTQTRAALRAGSPIGRADGPEPDQGLAEHSRSGSRAVRFWIQVCAPVVVGMESADVAIY
jgi:hypothetical protein